jgi:hypothetical protein
MAEWILARIGGGETVERRAELSRSDFTSVMLEVIRRHAAPETVVVLAPLGAHSVLGPVSLDKRIVVRGLADRGRLDGGTGPGRGRHRSRTAYRMRVLPRSAFQDQRARWRRGAGDRGRRLY